MRKSNLDRITITQKTGRMRAAASQLTGERLDAFFKFHHFVSSLLRPATGPLYPT
jgi:hypothetical protein